MKLKVYFEVYPWTNQTNVFFFGKVFDSLKPLNCTRYVAEIEVPDPDADYEKARVVSVEEEIV